MVDIQLQQMPRSYQVAVKAATAVTVGGSFLVLSGLILAATVIGLTVAMPVLVIFSPVLVPAVITLFLLIAGFVTSGGFGVAAAWIYRYVTGKHPPGADQLDQARMKLASRARDMKEFGQMQLLRLLLPPQLHSLLLPHLGPISKVPIPNPSSLLVHSIKAPWEDSYFLNNSTSTATKTAINAATKMDVGSVIPTPVVNCAQTKMDSFWNNPISTPTKTAINTGTKIDGGCVIPTLS